MIRRPPRSTLSSSSAASDVYKRQVSSCGSERGLNIGLLICTVLVPPSQVNGQHLSLIHISEPTRLLSISYAVFCLKKKKKKHAKMIPLILNSIIYHTIGSHYENLTK
eukprot:TRINITY_DN2575_c0_g1_i6.p1 TRINITY_DN2575_c0_g1~~TRINITY_DN2575_c0_g1_i6.p1  ORF type:complete len:108 (-),score=21.20 TRINITY_DN2575_c0_g1_i6:26-349(-)